MAVQNTDSLPVVVERQQATKDVWSDMVACFTSAGVPIKIFRNTEVRIWLEKNVKNGHTLPCETTLRKLLVKEGQLDIVKTTELCENESIIAIVDESMDIKNRKLLNILIGVAKPGSPSRLVTSKFVKKCDGATVSNAIVDALHSVSVATSQLVCLKSDNARYMLSAGKTLQGLSSRMIHSTCWSHVLHLVSEEIRGKMKKADAYISSIKSVLVKAPSRREELLDVMEAKGFTRTLPPVPVITRWCTWLEAGSFHYQHLSAETEWIEETLDNSAIMHKLKKMCCKDDLKEQLYKIHQVCPGISSSIKILEKRDLPASDVWLLLQTVLDLTNEVLGQESEKLNAYMEGRHPAITFWNDVQYFDPRKANQFVGSNGMEKLPPSLLRIAKNPIDIQEIRKYKTLRDSQNYCNQFCPFSFWKKFSREMPELSELALIALSIPASSSEVERSFSLLRRILTAQRSRFTEENLGIHLRMCFNQSRDSSTGIASENTVEFEPESESESEPDFDME